MCLSVAVSRCVSSHSRFIHSLARCVKYDAKGGKSRSTFCKVIGKSANSQCLWFLHVFSVCVSMMALVCRRSLCHEANQVYRGVIFWAVCSAVFHPRHVLLGSQGMNLDAYNFSPLQLHVLPFPPSSFSSLPPTLCVCMMYRFSPPFSLPSHPFYAYVCAPTSDLLLWPRYSACTALVTGTTRQVIPRDLMSSSWRTSSMAAGRSRCVDRAASVHTKCSCCLWKLHDVFYQLILMVVLRDSEVKCCRVICRCLTWRVPWGAATSTPARTAAAMSCWMKTSSTVSGHYIITM